MPNILLAAPKSWTYSIPFIVFIRILNGACQGVHFPSMISLTSQNLSANERTSFFSLLTAGSAIGTLLTGILGSFILDYFGWPSVFRIIGKLSFCKLIKKEINFCAYLGFLGLAWALVMRYYTMSSERYRVINLSVPNRLCISNRNNDDSVPWLKLFGKASFWACVLAHACQNNCFFVLLSWLPTYFHDGFPQAKVRSIFDINK